MEHSLHTTKPEPSGRPGPKALVGLAVGAAVCFHGTVSIFTCGATYDAYVHMFFADHYARSWFDPWEPRWYTGWTLTSYPPGAHQTIAALSTVLGLKNAFVATIILAVGLFTLGIYRFGRLWVSEESAAYGALLAVFSSCICQTVHVYGQIPTMYSMALLLNAIPQVKVWVERGRAGRLFVALAGMAGVVAVHHVTVIFGATFFLAPVLADAARAVVAKAVRRLDGRVPLARRAVVALRSLVPVALRSALFGGGLALCLVTILLAYWVWNKEDPIRQIAIPHGSRDNYLVKHSSGFMFFLVPWGLPLLLVPYVGYRFYKARAWPYGATWALLALLGTGGTTPLPKLILRGAFDILTLERFTFWASVMMLPLLGEIARDFYVGSLATRLEPLFGRLGLRALQVGIAGAYLAVALGVSSLTTFKPLQPAAIDPAPIVDFLEQDQHKRWRYLTLGFGDQMAWLSAHTDACSVDGNYHSARRLPELTTRAVERLENCKYSGVPGLSSLTQFLTIPEKFSLKYVFSNDKYYDPLLDLLGWHRVDRLRNGIVIWERADIPPLPSVLPRKEFPAYQRYMWGILPLTAIATALLALAMRALFPRSRLFAEPPKSDRDYAERRASALALVLAEEIAPPPTRLRAAIAPSWRTAPGAWLLFHRKRLLLLAVVASFAALARHLAAADARTPEEASILAYYDALDTNHLDVAYAQLDPRTRPRYEIFLLRHSVHDGLRASYAKLDRLTSHFVATLPDGDLHAVDGVWMTALGPYPFHETVLLRREGAAAFLRIPEADPMSPELPLLRTADVSWYAQGRRRIDMLRTKAEDELDRPQICVRSARVVRRGLDYAIVGELVNVDADPADLTIRGTLRDRRGAVVASYNAQFAALHKLFPGEETPFRIDFSDPDGEALLAKDARYDPTWTVPTRLREPPEKFELFVKSVVGTKDLLRPLTLENGEVRDGHLRGMLFDHSSRASTIPLLLLASYTRSGELRWVADALVPDGVRPGRTLPIEVPLVPVSEVVEVLPPDRGDFYVNYLPACRATGAPPATFPGGTSFSASAPSAPADGDLRVTVAGYVAE